jgi:hypothetical protein
VLTVADGQFDVDAGLATTPLNVKWQTSGNIGAGNGMDVKQGNTVPGPGPGLAARQVMVRIPFEPCGFDDPIGDVGNWAWSDAGMAGAVFYIKTAGGWCFVPLVLLGPCPP